MKNLKILYLIILSSLFTFCNKNEEKSNPETETLNSQNPALQTASVTIDGNKYVFPIAVIKNNGNITITPTSINDYPTGFALTLKNLTSSTTLNFSEFPNSSTNLANNLQAFRNNSEYIYKTQYQPECTADPLVYCEGEVNVTSFVNGTSAFYPSKIQGNFTGKLATTDPLTPCGTGVKVKLADVSGEFNWTLPN